MGLLNRIFSSSQPVDLPSHSALASADGAQPALSLAMPAGSGDLHVWRGQINNAHGLLRDIDELQNLNGAAEMEKHIKGGPKRPVHPDTLLERAHLSDPKQLTERLHANRLPGGTVVMATPTYAQRKLWQQNAQQHQISHVVRIGTDAETMKLDLNVREPVSSALTGGPDRSKVLSRHWDVSLGPNQAVPPSTLLETFQMLAARPTEPGCQVAFQSPDGDDRSAVFAAGWKVFKDLTAAKQAHLKVDDQRVMNAVRDAVLQIRMDRSSSLLQQPGHLASLLAMGMHLKDRLQQQGLRFSPEPQVRVFGERPMEPSPSALLDTVKNLAASRGFCEDIRQMDMGSELKFAPLKGSSAGERRIHQDSMMKPDPRLQGLPGVSGRLLAAWAAPKTLVLERPGPDQSLAWATACLTHNICAVVDVSNEAEAEAPNAMAPGSRTFGDGTEATFAWSHVGRVPLDDTLPGGSAIGMEVSASVKGEPITRDVSIDPPFMDMEHRIPTQRSLELIQVPLAQGQPVPPKRLLEIARIMESHRGRPGAHDRHPVPGR